MDLDKLDATIRELEEQLRLNTSQMDHSTPETKFKHGDKRTERDSGFTTLIGSYESPLDRTDDRVGSAVKDKQKSVQFTPDKDNEKYDLSRYLNKESARKAPGSSTPPGQSASEQNITVRRKRVLPPDPSPQTNDHGDQRQRDAPKVKPATYYGTNVVVGLQVSL